MADAKQRSRFLFRVQLSDDLSEQLDEALEIARLRTVLQPLGEIGEGLLSNPSLALLAGGGILAVIAGIVGKDAIEGLINYIEDFRGVMDAEPGSPAQHEAANRMITYLKSIIPFGFLVPDPGEPLTPAEIESLKEEKRSRFKG